ncbi:MAG TPA: hypothetical protein VF548_02380 [Allosphingosinicella sp.]|jgi:hypothetical protein
MASAIPAHSADEGAAPGKRLWVQPVVCALDLGEAEGSDGSGTDAGAMLS